MSDIKQLLEKATRKTEMRWRVFAFDPEQDNKLVHTSKDAFDCIKMAGEYKMDLAKKNPNYIIEIIAESKEQRNEADKMFLKKIEDVLHRYNLPSAKIVDERKVDNTHYIYKIDVNLTDYAKSLQKDVVDFDKLKKDNALKALSFLTIDGIYPQRNSQSILMQVNFHKGKPESAQTNEAYSEQYKNAWNNLKVGDIVRVTDFNYQFSKNMKVTRIYSNGTNKVVEFDFTLPSGKKYIKPLARIYKDSDGYKTESTQKNEANRCDTTKDYVKIISILDKELDKAKHKFPKATLKTNISSSSYIDFTKCLAFNIHEDDDAKKNAKIVEQMLVNAIKKANYDITKVDTRWLQYFIGNEHYSQIISVGSGSSNWNEYSAGYNINYESLKSLK